MDPKFSSPSAAAPSITSDTASLLGVLDGP
jgi:hypothetical protein